MTHILLIAVLAAAGVCAAIAKASKGDRKVSREGKRFAAHHNCGHGTGRDAARSVLYYRQAGPRHGLHRVGWRHVIGDHHSGKWDIAGDIKECCLPGGPCGRGEWIRRPGMPWRPAVLWGRARRRWAGWLTGWLALAIWRDVLHGPAAVMAPLSVAVAAVTVLSAFWYKHAYRYAWRVVTLTLRIASYGALPAEGKQVAELTAVAGSAVVAAGGSRLRGAIDRWRHRRHVAEPLISELSGCLALTCAQVRDGLHLPVDWSDPDDPPYCVVPPGWEAHEERLRSAARAIRQRLGGTEWAQSAEMATTKAGQPRRIVWRHAPPLPREVTLTRYPRLADLIRGCELGEVPIGLAARNVALKINFRVNPHLGMSMITGAGKTCLLKLICAVLVGQGVKQVIIIDPGGDHRWAIGDRGEFLVPGVEVYEDIEDMWDKIGEFHDAMKTGKEARRTARWSATFPMTLLIVDEGNLFGIQVQDRWDGLVEDEKAKPKNERERMPKRPPPFTWLHGILVEGRKFNRHMIGVYQKMSADAVGGGTRLATTMRSQLQPMIYKGGPGDLQTVAARGLKEPDLAGDLPGRLARIHGRNVDVFQALYISDEEARWIAAGMPGVFAAADWDEVAAAARVIGQANEHVPGAVPGQEAAEATIPGSRGACVIGPVTGGNVVEFAPRAADRHIGLREACESGVLPWPLPTAQTYRYRDGFPGSVGKAASGELRYSERALREYAAGAKVKAPKARTVKTGAEDRK